jgi:hypothetical protein
MTTIEEIRDLMQNWPHETEDVSPVSRGANLILALAGSDWYSDRDDDLQTMLRDALADIRHAYDLLQIEDPGFDVDDRAAARFYAAEVAAMGSAACALAAPVE